MVSEKMAKALNDQLNYEIYSAYVYASMSSWLKSKNLNGFANWMEIQTKEEMDHASMFYHFLHDAGANVEFDAIPKPKVAWESPKEVFENALEHERGVTRRVNELMDLALAEKDHATNARLQWFITEQLEEEANVLSILQQLELLEGAQPGALFMIDRELGQRTYNPPAAAAGT